MPAICCDDLAYAVTMRVVQDKNVGAALRVKDKDSGNMGYMPFKHCPWCGIEIPRNSPMSPVILYSAGRV